MRLINFGDEEEKLLKYITKLEMAQTSMVDIMNRCPAVQLNLNGIRQAYNSHSKALKKRAFQYKCVYHGGVRYRDYPREVFHSEFSYEFEEIVELTKGYILLERRLFTSMLEARVGYSRIRTVLSR